VIAWLLYGSLEQRTGGTIYDRIVIEGLRARGVTIEVFDPRFTPLRSYLRSSIIVGDELCHREIAFAFPRLPHARRVLLVHHLTCWEGAKTRVPEAKALRAADAVITTSEATRARLEHEGYRRPIAVVRPGSDRLARATPSPTTDATRFLFLGTVSERKRVRELVLAMPSGATLRVVGSMTRERRYAESVRAIASPAVAFLGELDEPALARELGDADALVMPSSLEGYGIAATEAIAAGVPVIAARMPGLEEALRPCPDAALFVDVDRDLARTLHAFAGDAALRERMREAAKRAKLPTWSETIAEFHRQLTASL
jgi:glycosyltransferase involved in cell wall biosynthesis